VHVVVKPNMVLKSQLPDVVVPENSFNELILHYMKQFGDDIALVSKALY